MTDIQIISPNGEAGTIPAEQKDTALAQGYRIPGSTDPNAVALNAPEHDKLPEYQEPGAPPTKPVSTTPLVNKQTGQEEYVPSNVAGSKILAGTHDIPDYLHEVPMVKLPEEGKSKVPLASAEPGTVPRDQVAAALASGQYVLDNPEIQAQRDELQNTKNLIAAHGTSGIANAGPVDVFLTKLEKQSPVYTVANALDPRSPTYQQAQEEHLNEYPTAATLGTGAGILANALTTGGVAGMATKAAGLTGLAKAVAEGAFYGLEPAAANLINKNPAGAAEDLALSTLGNVALHGLFSYLPGNIIDTAEAVDGKIPNNLSPEGWEELHQGKSIPDVVQREKLREQGKEAFHTILERLGVPANDKYGVNAVVDLLKHEIIRDAPLAENIKNIQNIEAKFGSYYEGMLKKLDASGNQFLLDSLAKSRQNLLEKVSSLETAPFAEQQEKINTAAFAPMIEAIDNAAKKGTFSGAQELISDLQKLSYSGKNEVISNLRIPEIGEIAKGIKDAETSAATALGDTSILDRLQRTRTITAAGNVLRGFADAVADKKITSSTPLSKLAGKLTAGHLGKYGPLGLAAHYIFGLGPIGTAVTIGGSLALDHWKSIIKDNQIGKAIGKWQTATELLAKAGKAQDTKILSAAKETIKYLDKNPKALSYAGASLSQGLASLLPNGGIGLSAKQQLDAVQKQVREASSNPTAFSNHMAAITQPLHDEGLAPVAQAYTDHQLRLLKALQIILPKDPTLQRAHPFTQNVEEKDINPAIKSKAQRAITVATKPEVLLDMIKSNTITPLDVAIASAVNPETMEKMRTAFFQEAVKNKPDISYQHRLSIGIFMGTNLDQSTDQLPILQNAYIPVAPVMPASAGKGKPSKKTQDNLDTNYQTVSEKSLMSGQ